MVRALAPMLAVAGRPPDVPGLWSIEMKWDGMRAIARSGRDCRLSSRTGRDITATFPEVAATLDELSRGRELIIDGEIVAPDPASGSPHFGRLQQRMHVRRPSAVLMRAVPTQYFAFDLLSVDGRLITALPYSERRRRLEDAALSAAAVQTPPSWADVDAATMLELAREHQLEGIVSKLAASPYRPGIRSPTWVKTPLRRAADVIVAGWLPGRGRFSTLFGSLILAGYDGEGRLVHIGNVGTGWTMRASRALQARLDELARDTDPFDLPPQGWSTRHAQWVEPRIVGLVEYREVTAEGLRHPSWRGVRPDKPPREVTVPANVPLG
ncbi:non-homologous end-joining DNA ligase [Nocardia asiatica]|uniref:non-homologous end-joining DNA ligase n=1 Tax=Nocardia asiatica TaxID=209252 RepID=UPI00313B38FD